MGNNLYDTDLNRKLDVEHKRSRLRAMRHSRGIAQNWPKSLAKIELPNRHFSG